MCCMTESPTVKSVRIHADTHARLMDLVKQRGGTADDALHYLLTDDDTVRVRVDSPEQREAWERTARTAGMPLPVFIGRVMEAALIYGIDRGGMHLMQQHVRELRAMVNKLIQMQQQQRPQ